MNQQILVRLEKEAEKLVLEIPASLDCDEYTALFNEKLAELIVKECVRYFNQDYERDFNTLWREDLTKGINKHFGVE